MLGAVSNALNGLNYATARLSGVAQNIATTQVKPEENAEPAPALDENLIEAKVAEVNYGANAKVLKAELDNEKKLLDILA